MSKTTAPKPIAPAGGSAWRHYQSKEVLGVEGSAGLIGIFSRRNSSRNPEVIDPELLEAEAKEAKARKYGGLSWDLPGVPPPDFSIESDESNALCRAQLSVFSKGVKEYEYLKEARIHAPWRSTVAEARKDGCELRRAAFWTARTDPLLQEVRRKCFELENKQWNMSELQTDQDCEEGNDRQLPEFTVGIFEKKTFQTAAEWFHEKDRKQLEEAFMPVGPNWVKTQLGTPIPQLPGVWYMHERQNQEGKHQPWLFFNASLGRYFRQRGDAGGKWVQTGTPHHPDNLPVRISHGSACLPAVGGRKDTMAVMLPELHRTCHLLKQPLLFMDRPAAMFLLVDGLRESSAAAAFCAQRFHTFFLPRLSSRQDEPEDFELVEMVNQAIEDLEKSLLDSNARYAGCGLALLLVLGQRVLVANVGNCRAVMCTPPKASGEGQTPSPKDPWKIRLLVGGGPSGHSLADVLKLERLRRLKEYAPLDFEGKPGDVLSGCSATAEELSAISDPRERALRRVAKAAHHFAALGFSATEAVTATAATVQKAVEDFERTVGKPDGTSLYTTALGRVKAAAKAVEAMISLDSFGTNQLAELCYVMDDEGGILSQKRAASILGVEPGCGEATAHAQVETRYRAVLSNLAGASPEGAASAWSIMGEVVDAAARPVAQLWAPPVENRAVAAARAMGLRDLKRPRKLVGLEIVSEVVHLEDNSTFCVMLLTEGMRDVTEAQIADAITLHKGKPKAACLRIAHEAAKKKEEAAEVKAVGAVAAYIDISDDYITEPDKAATKKLKTADGRSMPSAKPPSRIRIAHILLKCQPASGPAPSDPQARRQAPSDRTQADGEAQLLKLVEVLLTEYHKGPEAGASKRLSAKFAELAREHSDCKSATNGSLSDLGWINQGQHGKDFDAVAFELPVGGLSDIIVTQRGVHLLHRLA